MKIFRRIVDYLSFVPPPREDSLGQYERRQAECKRSGTRYYGAGGTIHGSARLDVEICAGEVVAIWFRCQRLPFRQDIVGESRANLLIEESANLPEICGVEVRDGETETKE